MYYHKMSSQEEINQLGDAFNHALNLKDKELIKNIIDSGIDLNAELINENHHKYMIGRLVTFHDDFADILEYMIDHGFDIKKKDSYGRDFICYALSNFHLCKILVKKGLRFDKKLIDEYSELASTQQNIGDSYVYNQFKEMYMDRYKKLLLRLYDYAKKRDYKKKIKELEKENELLKTHIMYMPPGTDKGGKGEKQSFSLNLMSFFETHAGSGYEETKEHFYSLAK